MPSFSWLPPEPSGPMRQHVVDGLEQGLSIINGLHVLLAEDAELVELAARHGARTR